MVDLTHDWHSCVNFVVPLLCCSLAHLLPRSSLGGSMASVLRLLASGRSIPGVFGLTLRLGGRWPAVGVCRSLADRPLDLSLSLASCRRTRSSVSGLHGCSTMTRRGCEDDENEEHDALVGKTNRSIDRQCS